MIAGAEDVVDRGSKFIESCAWDDDRISAPMGFLSDAQKSPTLIFAEFEMKPLSFDLNFFRFENAVHLNQPRV